jgi:predicted choloylglycine hydrolase
MQHDAAISQQKSRSCRNHFATKQQSKYANAGQQGEKTIAAVGDNSFKLRYSKQ